LEAPQAGSNEVWEAIRKIAHAASRKEHWEEGARANEKQERLAIYHNAVDVPIAERGIRIAGVKTRRQPAKQLAGRPKDDHRA
jgi:hypothetical protein